MPVLKPAINIGVGDLYRIFGEKYFLKNRLRGIYMTIAMQTIQPGSLWATYLDAVYKDYGDLRLADHYIERMQGDHLELGGGTGRIMKRALMKGHKSYNIDSDPFALQICRANLMPEFGERVKLQEADFTNPETKFPKDIGLITCMMSTITQVRSRVLRESLLAKCFNNLQIGGRLLIAILNDVQHKPGGYEKDVEGPLGVAHFVNRWDYGPDIDVKTWYVTITVGGITQEYAFPTLLVSSSQFRTELQAAGFHIEAMYGDLDMSAFVSEESPWQIYVGKKQ